MKKRSKVVQTIINHPTKDKRFSRFKHIILQNEWLEKSFQLELRLIYV